MNFVALKMLTGDRAKYLGLIFSIAFATFLISTRAEDGKFRAVILLGLDDATLVGVPHSMLLGEIEDLRQSDAVIIDKAGYQFFYPGEPLRVGRTMEMNDRRDQGIRPG